MTGEEIEGEYSHCPACGEPIAVDDPHAVGAVRPVDAGPNLKRDTGNRIEDGIGALFHGGCWASAGPGWRRIESP